MKGIIYTMTFDELVSLFDQGKIIPFSGRVSSVWSEDKKAAYQNFLAKHPLIMDNFFVFHTNKDGLLEIVDGRERIPLVIDFVINLDTEALNDDDVLKDIREFSFPYQVLTDVPDGILSFITKPIHSDITEPEIRQLVICPEKKQLIDMLVNESFFNTEFIQGRKNRGTVHDCAEILLAFCSCKDFKDVEKATLPSSLLEFVKNKPSSSTEFDNEGFQLAKETLSNMTHVFRDMSYVFRAIDFCYMAVLTYCINKKLSVTLSIAINNHFSEYYTLYMRMWTVLSPCITLNPLSDENIARVKAYFDEFISMEIASEKRKEDI